MVNIIELICEVSFRIRYEETTRAIIWVTWLNFRHEIAAKDKGHGRDVGLHCPEPPESAAEAARSPNRNLMDIHFRSRSIISHPFFSGNRRSSSSSSRHSSSYSPFKSFCSRRDSGKSKENGDNNSSSSNKGDKFSTDWDKAWSNFRKHGRKSLFSQFSPDKYVSWNPRRSEFPISEETDPIKRTERSNLMLWTSPGFTLVGAILIVSFLLLYTILAPIK